MCKYCEPNKHGICEPLARSGLGFGTTLVDIVKDENSDKLMMFVHYDGEEPLRLAIKFCPMCNRNLEEY